MEAFNCCDHIIICGWNDYVAGIIKGLTDSQAIERKQVIILSPQGENNKFVTIHHLDEKYVGYVNGKASNREDLDRANIQRAKAALAVADYNNSHSDEITILTILSIERYSDKLLVQGKRKKSIYTIAELIDPNNAIHLENAKCDEIISTRDISQKLMVHSALNQGLSRFLSDILTFNESNEIYSISITKKNNLIGKNFDEAHHYLRTLDITLLAIQSATNNDVSGKKIKMISNPVEQEKLYKIQENDRLLVLAKSGKILSKVIEKMIML